MRYFIVLLASFALALSACQAGDDPFSPAGSPEGTLDLFGSPSPGDASPDASPTESPDTTADTSPTGTADASPASPGETAGASPGTSPGTGTAGGACEDAFADVPDVTQLTSLSEFAAALQALDETIRSCDSVADWTEQADQALGISGMGLDAEDFLRARCDDSEELAATELCEEL